MRRQPDCHNQYMVSGTRADQARMPDRIIRAAYLDLYIHRSPAVPTDCNRRDFIRHICEETL